MTTKIALVGMGKMGHAIDQLAGERGCDVVARLDLAETSRGIARGALNGADVAIEFTPPAAAPGNIEALLDAGVPTVVGTTGWYDSLPRVRHRVEKNGG